MPHRHTIQPGDCLSSLASQHGFRSARQIADQPENQQLWARGRDPTMLVPGDQVLIPDPRPKVERRQTDARHTFRRLGPRTLLRLALEDPEGRALADAPFRLEIGADCIEGSTDARGVLQATIPPALRTAVLTVWQASRTGPALHAWTIDLGRLIPPVDEGAARQRISNLAPPVIDPVHSVRTPHSLRALQHDLGMPATGVVDPQTQAAVGHHHDQLGSM